MRSRTLKVVFRCIQVVPVLSLMFSGCTCSEKAPTPPATPTVAAPVAPATEAAESTPSETLPPESAAKPTEIMPTMVGSTPAAVTHPDASAARRECERYVGALSGREQDRELLKNPSVQALALQSSDLITCLAVKADSPSLCDPLIATQPSGQKQYSNEARNCLYSQSIFQEARNYPKGTSFTFPEIELQQCDDRKTCEPVREATRSGDEKKCDPMGAFQSICRAFVKLDKSLCRVDGELPKRKDEDSAKLRSTVEENCRNTIDSRAYLARGLKAVAESGSASERPLAQAALGQADACKQYEEAAMAKCLSTYVSVAPPQPPTALPASTPTAVESPPAEPQAGSATT